MEFISIGPYCSTTQILQQYNLRLQAYPFDYIFSSLEMIKHIIDNKFEIFLDKEYYIKGNHENSTKHLFYNEFLNTELLYLHHLKYNYPIDYKVSDTSLFNHHDLLDDTVHETFKRRCNRLLDLINNNKKIVFVYYNCYTATFDDLIDFSNNFSDNKNIFVLGIFQNNLEKKILFENSNCKIYQNFDNKYIFDEIKSTF